MKGKLFAFEGIDGSGKTTQIKILSQVLSSLGFQVSVTKAIKDELASGKQVVVSLMEEFGFRKNSIATMFLFQALHSRQCEETIKALNDGYIVLADRWNASFWVYHLNFGPLKGKPELLQTLDDIAFQGITPDLTFLLDVPVEIALERKRRQQRKVIDVFEQEELSIYKRAREVYLEIASSRTNWIVIDATKTILEIHTLVLQKIIQRLNFHKT